MKKGFSYHKVLFVFLLVMVGHISFGTGITEKSNRSNFTLKNLNKNKNVNLNATTFQFKGSQFLNVKKNNNNTIQVNSVIRYQNGNTTYVFPYKYKVKAPLFKTPTAPAIR